MEPDKKEIYTVFWLGTPPAGVEEERSLREGQSIKDIFYFNDHETDVCLKCLQLISNENVLLMITDMTSDKTAVDEKLLAQIHYLPQVKRIYANKKYYNHHPSELFPKVKQVSGQKASLYILADLRAHAQVTQPFVFNIFDERSSLTMNGDFIHFQMLISAVVNDYFPCRFFDNYSTFAKVKNEFLEACKDIYKNEPIELIKIEKFEQTYTHEQALHWYTQDSFAYRLLNQALRTNDTRLILLFRFFIIDLHRQLTENACKSLTSKDKYDLSSVYVYRGQRMAKHELNSIRKSLGSIISMKSFLSTSLDRQAASHYLWESEDFSDSSPIPVLVEIDLGNDNHGDSQTPFANITEHSYFGEAEKEVLFMVGSQFRVVEVRRGEKGIWYVRLATLASFDDPFTSQSQWSTLYDHMQRNFIYPLITSSSDIGTILLQSGKFDQAQTHYERLLQHLENLVYAPEESEDEEDEEDEERHESPSNTEDKSSGLVRFLKDLGSNIDERRDFEPNKAYKRVLCYYVLGRITQGKGLFDLSIMYYEAVLTQTSPSFLPHDPVSSNTYHILCALCHLGLGGTYELNGNLNRAFELYTKALYMFERAHNGFSDKLPGASNLTYVYKAHCLVGLGNLALIEQKYEQADKQYQEAVLLFDKYLPVGHPDQSRTRQKLANIVQIHRCKPAMALEDYEDCLENYLRSLPSDHVDIGRLYADMARAYEQLPNDLEKALEYAKKAAKIFEKGLPNEHKDNLMISMIIKQIQRKLCSEI